MGAITGEGVRVADLGSVEFISAEDYLLETTMMQTRKDSFHRPLELGPRADISEC